MRVTVDKEQLTVAPGATVSFTVEVVNTASVIDGVTARLIGLPEECSKISPPMLSLFPDASGTLTVLIAAPLRLPAGRHPLAVEVVSHGARVPPEVVDVELSVEARPAMEISAQPRIVRAHRTARTVVALSNPGNVRLQVGLRAADLDRSTRCRFSTSSLTLEPGSVNPVVVSLRGPRMIAGGELGRNVDIEATAHRLDIPPDDVDADYKPILSTTGIQFRQRPLIGRGLMTALILGAIVCLWAGAFLLGLAKVFSQDPLTKDAPASFFALTHAGRNGAVNAGFEDNGMPAPAGALPKAGQLPPGVGSEIDGTVDGAADGQPVGRILVQAIRLHGGSQIVVSSAGTQADGTYALAGLFPMSYYLKFSAPGFRTIWYPGAHSIGSAQLVTTPAQGTRSVRTVTIHGDPASISGRVDPGDTLTPVVTTVSARPLIGGVGAAPIRTATTDAQGAYHLPNLPAPASYELTFTADGYQTSSIVDSVTGGEARLEPLVSLSSGEGQISGIVRDAVGPLGGATVTTVVNGATFTVMTPTVGQVGAYTLDHLPTPGTYVITYSAPSHGTVTRIVHLGVGAAGGVRTGFDTTLVAGIGSVHGVVLTKDGNGNDVPLGDVTITVGGASLAGSAAAPPSTQTLTGGGSATGTFVINGLAAPGSYTLTAQAAGYAPATVPFVLDGTTAQAKKITIYLSSGVGSIEGTVSCPAGKSCAGATVTATNGLQVWTTQVSVAGGSLPSGGYLISDLPPGTYSVTVSEQGLQQQTAMVVVRQGPHPTVQNLALGG